MSTNGIQVMGAENVLQWYLNGKVPCFAIWAGKNLVIRYDGHDPQTEYDAPSMEIGAQVLEHCLSAMYEGSTAIYTLKTYELGANEKIKPSTEYNTAFNFRLHAPEVGGSYGGNRLILEEIKKMNARVIALESEDDEEEDKTPGIMGALADTIEDGIRNPEKLYPLISIVSTLMGKPMAFQPATMGNVHRMNETGNDSFEKRVDRLRVCVETLEKADPKFLEHLEVLAGLAKNNQQKFQSIIAMIGML